MAKPKAPSRRQLLAARNRWVTEALYGGHALPSTVLAEWGGERDQAVLQNVFLRGLEQLWRENRRWRPWALWGRRLGLRKAAIRELRNMDDRPVHESGGR